MYIIKKNKNNKWIIIKKGSKRATRIFDTKLEAIMYAKEKYPDNYEVEDEKAVEKAIKKHGKKPWFIILVIIFLLILAALGFAIYMGYITIPGLDLFNTNDKDDNHNHSPNQAVEGVVYDNFQMHFLELGNEYTGDSTYIKAGDVDILIDAGSRKNSAVAIKEYVDKYCTDGKLEYVIATHAHQDHIAGFVGSKSGDTRTGIFYQYEIEVFIDFALSDVTSKLYTEEYVEGVEYLEDNGTKHYQANECWNEENGAKKQYQITDNVTMDILYNKFYFEKAEDENDYSVCTLFTYTEGSDSHRFMLTGDLEQEGEEALAKYYKTNGGLGHCDLFKAGHHGSFSSTNECLLELITPDVCTVCCCAGATEYTTDYTRTFPSQDFINRISKYTDAVYVTTVYDKANKTYTSLNGTIIVSCKAADLAVACTKNNKKLKDSDWFNETIYYINDKDGDPIFFDDKNDVYYTALTEGAIAAPQRVWPSTQ